MPDAPAVIPAQLRDDVTTLWNYHDMKHELRPVDVGIGLGSHDPGVAMVATELFHQKLFAHLVFTGANAPTTRERYPRGEAVHYREYAVENGVPAEAILIETAATNTGDNIKLTRQLLADHEIKAQSVILMSRPYQQRRAYATCRKIWPEVDVLCASHELALDDYVAMIADVKRVIDMLVGDTQRIDLYAERGFAIPQPMPDEVRGAFRRLAEAGFTSRLL